MAGRQNKSSFENTDKQLKYIPLSISSRALRIYAVCSPPRPVQPSQETDTQSGNTTRAIHRYIYTSSRTCNCSIS